MTEALTASPTQFDRIAERWSVIASHNLHNSRYERPVMRSLIGDVTGLRVLDAGCGPGALTRWLLEHGADAAGVDGSSGMVAVGAADGLPVRQADLREPLEFLADREFDLVVSSLVLDYLESWQRPLGEFARVLRPGGRLLVSLYHPTMTWLNFRRPDYFATELVHELLRGYDSVVGISLYRRPLHAVFRAWRDAGFRIDALHEPDVPSEMVDEEAGMYRRLKTRPHYLFLDATR